MEINGLPLHALVVHAAVVFGPLAALAGVLYVALPTWRDKLRWPLVVDRRHRTRVDLGRLPVRREGRGGQHVRRRSWPTWSTTHEERAEMLRLLMSGFAAASFVAAWQHARTGRSGRSWLGSWPSWPCSPVSARC